MKSCELLSAGSEDGHALAASETREVTIELPESKHIRRRYGSLKRVVSKQLQKGGLQDGHYSVAISSQDSDVVVEVAILCQTGNVDRGVLLNLASDRGRSS
jgi:hypothetical protein